MELGGHGPVIVCEDADSVVTAATSATAKSRNAGQVCVSSRKEANPGADACAGSSTSPQADNSVPAIAAVLYEQGDPVEELMAAVAQTLGHNFVRVGGLVQHNHRAEKSARCQFELENVSTGLRYRLTQNLGSASQSCALDTAALADASWALRQAVADRVEIVIVNKFGTQEANGIGLRDEMMQIAMAGIPMLTSVGRRYLAQWREFVGEEAVLLPLSLPAVLSWWQCIQPRPQ